MHGISTDLHEFACISANTLGGFFLMDVSPLEGAACPGEGAEEQDSALLAQVAGRGLSAQDRRGTAPRFLRAGSHQ